MRVICAKNEIASIEHTVVQDRLRRSIHLDGPMTDLVIGQRYEVQAVESSDCGIWFFLHTVAINDFPYPYPAEFFDIEDNALSPGWCARFGFNEGNTVIQRITFSEWANDDDFYEKLVEGDAKIVAVYQRYFNARDRSQ